MEIGDINHFYRNNADQKMSVKMYYFSVTLEYDSKTKQNIL